VPDSNNSQPSLDSLYDSVASSGSQPSLDDLYSQVTGSQGPSAPKEAATSPPTIPGIEPYQPSQTGGTILGMPAPDVITEPAKGVVQGFIGTELANRLNPEMVASAPKGGTLAQRVFDNKLYYTGYLFGQAAQYEALGSALKWLNVGSPLVTDIVKNGLIAGSSSYAENADIPQAMLHAVYGSALTFGGQELIRAFGKNPAIGLESKAISEAASVEAEQFPKQLGQYLDGIGAGKITKVGPTMQMAKLAMDNVLGRIPFIKSITGLPSMRDNLKRVMSIVKGDAADEEVKYLADSAGELFEGASDSISSRVLDLKKAPETYRARSMFEESANGLKNESIDAGAGLQQIEDKLSNLKMQRQRWLEGQKNKNLQFRAEGERLVEQGKNLNKAQKSKLRGFNVLESPETANELSKGNQFIEQGKQFTEETQVGGYTPYTDEISNLEKQAQELTTVKKVTALERMRVRALAQGTESELDRLLNRAFQIEKDFMPKAQELINGYKNFTNQTGKNMDMGYPLRVLDDWVTSRMDDVASNLPEIKVNPDLSGIDAAKEVASQQKEIIKAYGKVMGEFERLPLVQEIKSIGQQDLTDQKIMLNVLRHAEELSKDSGFQQTHAESLVSLLTAFRKQTGDRKAMAAAAQAELGAIDAMKLKDPKKAIDIVEKFFKMRQNFGSFIEVQASKAMNPAASKPMPGTEQLKTNGPQTAYQAAEFNRQRRGESANPPGAGRAAAQAPRTVSDMFRDSRK